MSRRYRNEPGVGTVLAVLAAGLAFYGLAIAFVVAVIVGVLKMFGVV